MRVVSSASFRSLTGADTSSSPEAARMPGRESGSEGIEIVERFVEIVPGRHGMEVDVLAVFIYRSLTIHKDLVPVRNPPGLLSGGGGQGIDNPFSEFHYSHNSFVRLVN
jgi:hypothetical protein